MQRPDDHEYRKFLGVIGKPRSGCFIAILLLFLLFCFHVFYFVAIFAILFLFLLFCGNFSYFLLRTKANWFQSSYENVWTSSK